MNFLKNNVCSLFFLSTKIVMSTLRALWRLNQKSYVQFDQIEKMCHFTLYNFVFTVKAMFVHFLSVQPLEKRRSTMNFFAKK